MDDIDSLAQLLSRLGLVLCYSDDGARLAFTYRNVPAQIKQRIRNRRRGLQRMLAAGDIRLCASPGLHRASWYYAGQGRYVCEVCRRIDAQMCLWRAC